MGEVMPYIEIDSWFELGRHNGFLAMQEAAKRGRAHPKNALHKGNTQETQDAYQAGFEEGVSEYLDVQFEEQMDNMTISEIDA